MSADFNIDIVVRGTHEEFLAILCLLKNYETRKNDVYINWITISKIHTFFGLRLATFENNVDKLKEAISV